MAPKKDFEIAVIGGGKDDHELQMKREGDKEVLTPAMWKALLD